MKTLKIKRLPYPPTPGGVTGTRFHRHPSVVFLPLVFGVNVAAFGIVVGGGVGRWPGRGLVLNLWNWNNLYTLGQLEELEIFQHLEQFGQMEQFEYEKGKNLELCSNFELLELEQFIHR